MLLEKHGLLCFLELWLSWRVCKTNGEHRMNLKCLGLLTASLLVLPSAGFAEPVSNRIDGVCFSPETATAREARRQQVEARRAGPVIIVHRGASSFAPENSLQAYAAAMDYGADGCEIDIRRSADGVLVMFHDDALDRLMDSFGPFHQHTYSELAGLPLRSVSGGVNTDARIPSFAAVLELARQRAMLLHLDIKQPHLEEDIASLLNAADAWDHVVFINEYNSATLRENPRLKTLSFKAGGGLYNGRRDCDPAAVRETLAKPGSMIIVDDPRVAARELRRAPFNPVPPPPALHTNPPATQAAPRDSSALDLPAFLRALTNRIDAHSPGALLALLSKNFAESNRVDGNADSRRERTKQIVERAWAAQRIGQLGIKSPRAIECLEHLVANRSLHRDRIYHGLDGTMAARSLAALGARESVPVLIETFRNIDPELDKLGSGSSRPVSWIDSRPKMEIIFALGSLPCAESKDFLLKYVAMDETEARQFSIPSFEAATLALLRQQLSGDELKALLQSRHSAVRGTAILECVDRPDGNRTAALRSVAPWALHLPRRGDQ
jgi:hypothetical protein